MANNTYVALDKVTIGSTTTSATFNSIPQTYTDLVVVMNVVPNGTGSGTFIVNGDTSAIYSNTTLAGLDSVASSFRSTGLSSGTWLSSGAALTNSANLHLTTMHFMNYSNTTTFKTILHRENPGQFGYVGLWANLYRSTSAITSITMQLSSSFGIGTTVSLYGIKSESASSTPKATGGTIYSNATYFYHVFGASGTFTPTTSISNAEYLVIAGGGAGGVNQGAGGGAGGYRSSVVGESSGGGASAESQVSFASGTAYTVTVGAGGVGGFNSTPQAGADGTASSISGSAFTTISTVGGGGGGAAGFNGRAGGSGGGAGGSGSNTAGARTVSQGFVGGGYGGGGAGGAGATEGGIGLNSSITGESIGRAGGSGSPGVATWGAGRQNISQRVSNGVANTGSGGAPWDGTYNSGSGGSGIVIIRYLKA